MCSDQLGKLSENNTPTPNQTKPSTLISSPHSSLGNMQPALSLSKGLMQNEDFSGGLVPAIESKDVCLNQKVIWRSGEVKLIRYVSLLTAGTAYNGLSFIEESKGRER